MAAGATSGRSANGWKPPGRFCSGRCCADAISPEFVAEGCLQDDYLSDLLIMQAFLGTLVEDDANVGLEVISVEFIADDRAMVTGLLTIDGRPADECSAAPMMTSRRYGSGERGVDVGRRLRPLRHSG